jgi:glucose dehydrogenase
MGSKRFRGSILLCLLVGLIAALVISGCGGGGSSSSSTTETTEEKPAEPAETTEPAETAESEGIAAAPEFTSEELNEPAGDNWVTNGGGTTNDRFSTLSEINTENVKELKGDWMTKIGSNATAAKFSAEGQALEYNGTIYISDGADDAFAMDASNGEISGPTNPTSRRIRSAKSSAAVGTTAVSQSATAWSSSRS